jgi:hypothetical protein
MSDEAKPWQQSELERMNERRNEEYKRLQAQRFADAWWVKKQKEDFKAYVGQEQGNNASNRRTKAFNKAWQKTLDQWEKSLTPKANPGTMLTERCGHGKPILTCVDCYRSLKNGKR